MTERIELPSGDSVVVIPPEADDVCEGCGKVDELRPYGKRLESGRRMRLCFDCGMQDKPTTDAAIKELFDGV